MDDIRSSSSLRRALPPEPAEPKLDSSPALPVLVGAAVIFLFFGVFGVWAALSPLNGAVVGNGIVAVEGNRKSVEHLEGGVVAQVHVRDGDMVEGGDLLLTMDSERAQAQLDLFAQQFAVARALEARLLAERKGADQLDFPAELTTSGEAYVDEAIASERDAFAARRNLLSGAQAVLQHKIEDLETQIEGRRLRLAALDLQLASMQAELESLEMMLQQGLGTRERVLQLQRSITSLQSERQDNEIAITSAEVNIAENRQQISQIEYERRSSVVAELASVQQKLLDLGPSVTTARAALERTRIIAPASGKIVGLKVSTAGEVLQPGETILEIVPQEATMVVSVRFRVEDIADLSIGSPAQVQFMSTAQLYAPVLEGKLTKLSADRLVDERSGLGYFQGEVEIDEKSILDHEQLKLYPGMPVTVMVTTQSRSALDYILGPLLQAMSTSLRER